MTILGSNNCGCSPPIWDQTTLIPTANSTGTDGSVLVFTEFKDYNNTGIVSWTDLQTTTISTVANQLAVGDGYRIQYSLIGRDMDDSANIKIRFDIEGTTYGTWALPSGSSRIFVEIYLYRNGTSAAFAETHVRSATVADYSDNDILFTHEDGVLEGNFYAHEALTPTFTGDLVMKLQLNDDVGNGTFTHEATTVCKLIKI